MSDDVLLVTATGDAAGSWVEAFERLRPGLRRAAPDHTLTDAAMAMRGTVIVFDTISLGVSGLLACHRLSQFDALAPVPKIVIVPSSEEEDRAYSAGAHVVVVGEPDASSLADLSKALRRLNRIREVESQTTQMHLLVRSLESAYDATIEGWVRALDLRDRETEEHSIRVATLTVQLAKQMGFDRESLTHVYRGALLHDIGKIAVPDAVLQKADSLTNEERKLMQLHPEFAYQILSRIAFLSSAMEIPYCHHEKWDGTGYPNGVAGEDIPLSARVFAVVDVYDALRFDRPYRKGWPEDQVREHIRTLAGIHFDPVVVDEFLQMLSFNDSLEVPA